MIRSLTLLLSLLWAGTALADDSPSDDAPAFDVVIARALAKSTRAPSVTRMLGEQGKRAFLIQETEDHLLMVAFRSVTERKDGGLDVSIKVCALAGMQVESRYRFAPDGKLVEFTGRLLPQGWGASIRRGKTGWTTTAVPAGPKTKPKPVQWPDGCWPEGFVTWVVPALAADLPARTYRLKIASDVSPSLKKEAGTLRLTPGNPLGVELSGGTDGDFKARVTPASALVELRQSDRVVEPIPWKVGVRLRKDTVLANEYQAMSMLHDIRSNQRRFLRRNKRYPTSQAELSEPLRKLFRYDKAYTYRVRAAPGGKVGIAFASPRKPGKTGRRYFAVDERGRLWWASKPFPDDGSCRIPDYAKPITTGPKPR